MYIESNYNHYINDGNKIKIYNAKTKACISVENVDAIGVVLQSNDNDAINTLKELGFIVDNADNEMSTMAYLFNKYYFGREKTLTLILTPSLACNFKCPYCFERRDDNSDWFDVDIDSYFAKLKKFIDNNHSKYDHVLFSLFGGEPLLFFEKATAFFHSVVSGYPNLSINTSVTTNGSLLSKTVIEELIKYNCRSIQVTIDGCKRVHDQLRVFKNGRPSFDLLVKKINELLPLFPDSMKFVLRVNLNNVKPDEVKNMLLCFDPDLRSKIQLLFRPIYNTNTYSECNNNKYGELSPFLLSARDLGFTLMKNVYKFQACESCSGDNVFFVMPDLSLWKCINDLNISEAKVGEIDNNGNIDLDAYALINWYRLCDWTVDEECRKCKMLPDCFGGCVLQKLKNNKKACREIDMNSLSFVL